MFLLSLQSRLAPFAICCALFCGSALGARVALIVPDEALEGALTAELSKKQEIELIERSSLPSIARESALSGNLKNLAGAEIVVIGEKQSNGSHTVRLADPATGAVLQAFLSPPGLDPQNEASWLTRRITPWLDKSPGDISQRFSLIGLRFDVDSIANRQIERSLNLALAAALQVAPGVAVLERWKLNDLVFEKELAGHGDESFWRAAQVLDGSISAKDRFLYVKMRVRTGETVSEIEAEGPIEALPDLANKLAAQALKTQPSEIPFAKLEPSAFVAEAQWLSKHGLKKEAAQALETAIALSPQDQHVELQRICAYAEAAYPDTFFYKPDENGVINEEDLPAESLPSSIALATTMCGLTIDYMEKYASMPRQEKPDLPFPPNIGIQALSFPLAVLQTAHKQGYWKQDAAALNELRLATRQLVDTIKKSRLADDDDWHDLRGAFYRQLIPRAAYWNPTPEETLEFYERVLSPEFEKECPNGKYLARWNLVMQRGSYTPPSLGQSGPRVPEPYMKTTFCRLIDWNDPGGPHAGTQWSRYVQSKIASPDVLAQADGLGLLKTSSPTWAGQEKVQTLQAEFFLRNSDEMYGPNGQAIWMQVADGVTQECCLVPTPEYQSKAIERYIGLLNAGRPLAESFVGSLPRFIPSNPEKPLPESVGHRLRAALDEYSKTLGENSTETDKSEFRSAQSTINAAFPDLVPTYPPDAMPVTRVWLASEHTPEELRRDARFDPDSGIWHGGSLWFIDEKDRKIWKINPSTFDTEMLACPNRPASWQEGRIRRQGTSVALRNRHPVFVGKKLYLPEQGTIWIADLTTNRWASLPLPDAHYSLCLSGTKLYATFGDSPGEDEVTRGEGFGLYEIDTATDKAELIFSSRRRPASHPLDAAEGTRPFCVLPTPDGQSLVGMLKTNRIFNRLDDGREDPIIPNRLVDKLVSRQGDSLFFSSEYRKPEFLHTVQRMSPSGKFETLLWNPESDLPQPATPVWKFPESISESRKSFNQIAYVPAMHGDDLFLLVYDYGNTPWGAGRVDLYRFRRERPDARRISLHFRLSPDDENLIKHWHPNTNAFLHPMVEPYGLIATDVGLVISGRAMPGFWFISWTELKDYEERTIEQTRTGPTQDPPGSHGRASIATATVTFPR